MFPKLTGFLLAVAAALLFCAPQAPAAAQLKITIPKRSNFTPVQKLNREGVKAVQKHDYEKAKKLFYKAYLLDPNDPFTLNNLGYISELEGNIDRAQRFYALAEDQNSDALVDEANVPSAQGKPVNKVAGSADDRAMEVNRDNVQAIGLLLKDRAPEADMVLQKALALDPNNPFTLNNIGYTKEKEGEWENALGYYMKAAQLHSQDPVVVTANRDWRGKPISDIAAQNAKKLQKQLSKSETAQARVSRLNLQGVSALNRNDHATARKAFDQAYKLNENDAFTLNNMGYLAEMDGDKETADFYYDKAREAQHAKGKVSVATRRDVQGMPLKAVAEGSGQAVQQRIQTALVEKRRQGGPVRLMRRDNTPVIEPEKPPTPAPSANNAPANAQPNGGLLMPLPANEQPPAADRGGAPVSSQPSPPASSQPATSQPARPSAQPTPSQPSNTQPGSQPNGNGGLLMPLPDNEQPANADKGGAAVPSQPSGNQPGNAQPAPSQPAPAQPGTTQPPASQPPASQPQGSGGLLMPLPDTQQPDSADKGPAQVQGQPAGSQPAQPSPAPPSSPAQPPSSQPNPSPAPAQPNGGMIQPLPDSQQPPNAGAVPPATTPQPNAQPQR